MDENIANFTAITSADPERAAQYLQLADNNLEQAIQLFFDSPNLDVGNSNAPPAAPPAGTSAYQDEGIVQIDSDDETDDGGATSRQHHAADASMEDDEAMARRLQEEMYGSGPAGAEEVRAPIERRQETLVGPGASYLDNDDDMHAAVMEQLANRRRTAAGASARAGIFNQRPATSSVWEPNDDDEDARRRNLAQATAGASESSSKSSMLAEMYRPPFEIMSRLPWDQARDEGKSEEKWLLVNVQDAAIFDCQVLNRDIWKNEQIKETVKENFIFMQYAKDDPRGNSYINYYFHARDSGDAYPHIAIVDPRTGEQVKVWSGPPVPKPMDFLMQLHEFLDRYSLKVNVRNPVAARKPEKKKDVNKMTEDEMLEMALKNSMEANNGGPRDEDPDSLTKNAEASEKGKERASDDMDVEAVDSAADAAQPAEPEPESTPQDARFASVSASNPHAEPPADPATTTRIQFRYSGGRLIRRFATADPVRRIYEWLKAAPLEGKDGVEFELILMGKNLIDVLDRSIEEVGLKQATIMIEFLED